ncbi:hypothetical protein FLK61_36960 [Paenalkalicoccus suaedae]|uniref:Uncharacterized protein n=1 Tax=Paenalkalicoccus suaedae TaxID=2592382 RepID=A0A859FFU8_9BACI|nr:hypothetical protein [Paenalkalicoccus suaedae]QKS72233.1 hypothetical protein FLK61_36960 [Paenalkalicoccus suaedae]
MKKIMMLIGASVLLMACSENEEAALDENVVASIDGVEVTEEDVFLLQDYSEDTLDAAVEKYVAEEVVAQEAIIAGYDMPESSNDFLLEEDEEFINVRAEYLDVSAEDYFYEYYIPYQETQMLISSFVTDNIGLEGAEDDLDAADEEAEAFINGLLADRDIEYFTN